MIFPPQGLSGEIQALYVALEVGQRGHLNLLKLLIETFSLFVLKEIEAFSG